MLSPMPHPKFLSLLSILFSSLNMFGQVADAWPDTSLCVNSYTMQGSPLPPGATGQWVLYMGCATINDPTSPTTLITDMCTGENVFGWTTDDGGTITSDVVSITVYDPNMPVANAGMDQTIVGPQSSAVLSGSPVPVWPATCWWSWVQGSGVLAQPNEPVTMVSGLAVGDNIFTWTCENGPCGTTSDTLVIQMMMITGMDETVPTPPAFIWDPVQHRLQYTGIGSISGLLLFDAHGRTVPLGSNAGQRTWQAPLLKPGVYLLRAAVDGSVVHHRFVVSE